MQPRIARDAPLHRSQCSPASTPNPSDCTPMFPCIDPKPDGCDPKSVGLHPNVPLHRPQTRRMRPQSRRIAPQCSPASTPNPTDVTSNPTDFIPMSLNITPTAPPHHPLRNRVKPPIPSHLHPLSPKPRLKKRTAVEGWGAGPSFPPDRRPSHPQPSTAVNAFRIPEAIGCSSPKFRPPVNRDTTPHWSAESARCNSPG
jgi:hypothetical protein